MSNRSLLSSLPALSFALLPLAPLAPLSAATPPQSATPVAAAAASVAQPIAARLPITHDVYATWRSIQHTQLSRDGQWIAYALVAQEADGELVVRHVADGREYRAPRGTSPQFSADGRFVAFAVQPTRVELDKAKKDKKKGDDAPQGRRGLDGPQHRQGQIVDRVKRFAWGKDGGQHLALLLEAPAKKEGSKDAKAAPAKVDAEMDDGIDAGIDADLDANPRDQEAPAEGGAPSAKKVPGNDLLLIDAETKQRNAFKDASDFAWNNGGTLLAYVVSVKEPAKKDASKPSAPAVPAASASAPRRPRRIHGIGRSARGRRRGKTCPDDAAREGVYLIDPAAPTQARAVMSGAGSYKQLRFDEAGRRLAFVSSRDHVAETKAAEKAKRADEKEEKKDEKADRPDPTPFKLFLWKAGQERAAVLVSAQTAGMPAGWTPSEHAALAFSEDGQRLFLGTAELPAPRAQGCARADEGRPLALEGSGAAVGAEGQGRAGAHAQLPRGRALGRRRRRGALRAARDEGPAHDPGQRERHRRARPERTAVSPADVVGRCLHGRLCRRPEHRCGPAAGAQAAPCADAVAGRPLRAGLRRAGCALDGLAHRHRRRHRPHRQDQVALRQRRPRRARPALPLRQRRLDRG
ncbi:hypothetical protein ACFJIX_10905 [Roseateles sp. UC29_93]|uniref:hypothetical protein n=1 Tax=Roseateles sp. UC29_93 TaxID=3350177 RepID=UPI00366E2D4F